MCAGFAVAATSPALRGGIWTRLAAYHAGKAVSYVFLGLLLLVGLEFAFSREWLIQVQRTLSLGLALGMAVLGVAYVTGWRWLAPWERWLSGAGGCAPRLGGPTALRSLLIGWVNGFLPCGLSLAAILYVLRFRDPLAVALGLLWFGLATVPVLATVTWIGGRLSVKRRMQGLRWGGILLLLGAVVTAARAVPVLHAWVSARLGQFWGLPVDPWCS